MNIILTESCIRKCTQGNYTLKTSLTNQYGVRIACLKEIMQVVSS